MSIASSRPRGGYKLGYKKLVARLSQELSRENVRMLVYMYNVPGLASDPAGSELEALAVLERLEQADCFSYDHPERLGEIMKELERIDLSKTVDNFIGNHCKATTTDLQVDGPFRPHTQPSGTTGKAANPPELDEEDPPYVYFIPPPRTFATGCHSTVSGPGSSVARESSDGTLSSPTSSVSSSTSDSNSGGHHEQDDNDPVYDYPRQWLVNLPSEMHPLIERTLRLLVAPIRSMISRRQFEMVSAVIDHRISKSHFELRIDPRGREDHPSISTSLWLLKGSTLNSEVPLQAELTMTQPAKKPKGKPRGFEVKRKTKPTSVYQGLILIDVPKSSHGKTTQNVVVARFPGIISHKHLLNESIIKAPFLELKLVIRQFPEQ